MNNGLPGLWFDSMMAYATTEHLEKVFGIVEIPKDPHPSATEAAERHQEKLDELWGRIDKTVKHV